MRGLAGAAIVALSTGLGFAGARDTSTAVIPLDLGHLDFGRELTLLLTVAESPEACGPSDIQINGQALSTQDGPGGRDTVYEDYGSEIVASWMLECTEVDDKPVQQAITVQIDSLDGVDYEDLVFTVTFHQSSPVAILGVEGSMIDFPAVDLTGGNSQDFWTQHHGEGDADSEVEAATSEIQFLRIQQREIGERIRVLEKFIQDSDAEKGVCRGRLRCLVRSILKKVTGMASKAYEIVIGPSNSHSEHHGNGTHAAHPPPKRPLWRPPFCPCAPTSPPTVPPADPTPEDPPAADDKSGNLPDIPEPEIPDVEIPDIEIPDIVPPTPDVPSDAPGDDPDKGNEKTQPLAGSKNSWSTSKFTACLIFVFFLVTITVILLRRAKECLNRRRQECALRRRERRRQRFDDAVSFFRGLFPGPRPQPCTAADMEQQVIPPPPEESQRMSRSQSDASNTMEQDLAQFRAAVDMVGSMVAVGGESSRRNVDVSGLEQGRAVSRRGFTDGGYPQDLPPAYESEDEDAPMLSAISDGFRPVYGSSGYSPTQGSSTGGNADSLGYAKP